VWGAALYTSTNQEEYQQLLQSLNSWFLEQGATSKKPPKWSVYAYDFPVGRQVISYTINVKTKPFEIIAMSEYGGTFTDSQLHNIQKANYMMWTNLFKFVKAQKNSNDLLSHDPSWFDRLLPTLSK